MPERQPAGKIERNPEARTGRLSPLAGFALPAYFYLSPEKAAGNPVHQDAVRCDVWSFLCMIRKKTSGGKRHERPPAAAPGQRGILINTSTIILTHSFRPMDLIPKNPLARGSLKAVVDSCLYFLRSKACLAKLRGLARRKGASPHFWG
jgi:hypothetical protein